MIGVEPVKGEMLSGQHAEGGNKGRIASHGFLQKWDLPLHIRQ